MIKFLIKLLMKQEFLDLEQHRRLIYRDEAKRRPDTRSLIKWRKDRNLLRSVDNYNVR